MTERAKHGLAVKRPSFRHKSVQAKIKALFPHEDPTAIIQILDEYGTCSGEVGRERVQLAILKLSEGSLDALRSYLALAKTDYRDVLAMAEYPGQSALGFVGWKELSEADKKRIRNEDLRQYTNWLRGKT